MLALVLLFAEAARAPSVHIDFAPLYGAGVLALQGRLSDAYSVDPEVGKRAGETLTKAVHERRYPLRYCLRYLHPPALAFLFAPLVSLDFPYAATIFRLFSLAALGLSAFMLARLASGDHRGFAFALIFLLVFDPVRMTLELGQTNLFVLATLCAALLAKRSVVSGLAMAVAGLIKSYALMVPLAWFALGGKWRTRALWTAFFVLFAHSLAHVLQPEATFAYLDMLQDLSQKQFLWPEQQALAALVTRIETGFQASDVALWREVVGPAGAGRYVAILLSAVVTAAVIFLMRVRELDGFAAIAIAIPAGLMASPILHSHYGTVLVLPGAWLLRHCKNVKALWLGFLGIALNAVPLHADEARAWVPLFEKIGIHWVFVTYRLAGVVLVFASTVLGSTRGSFEKADQ